MCVCVLLDVEIAKLAWYSLQLLERYHVSFDVFSHYHPNHLQDPNQHYRNCHLKERTEQNSKSFILVSSLCSIIIDWQDTPIYSNASWQSIWEKGIRNVISIVTREEKWLLTLVENSLRVCVCVCVCEIRD